MRARTWESVLPLQSSSSLILASISREGDSPLVVALFFILFAPHSAVFLSCEGTNHQSSAPACMRPASVPAFRPNPIARPNPLEQAHVSRAQPHRAHDRSPEDQPRYRHAIRQARPTEWPHVAWSGSRPEKAGQRGGLLHPVRHLRLVELVAFVDVDVARVLALAGAGRDR